MKTKTIITVTLAFLLMGLANVPSTAAQLAPKQEEVQPKPSESYKLDFAVSELDNGKKINSRSYSMLIRAEAAPKFTGMKNLRIGSRVPYSTSTGTGAASNDIQYQDIGMNIDCRLMPMGNGNVVIEANWEYSTVAEVQEAAHATLGPVFRQVRSRIESIVPLDKPTVLAEMDDVASTRHYVFEVKVTKISE
jgi:hypothetical protein